MSEVTLHGHPVKVGDRVWNLDYGWMLVCDGTNDIDNDTVIVYLAQIPHSTLFWQPIDPAAIEAAKVRPKEPEYEWQWNLKYTQKASQEAGNEYYRTCHYRTIKEAIDKCQHIDFVSAERIEDSRREVTE